MKTLLRGPFAFISILSAVILACNFSSSLSSPTASVSVVSSTVIPPETAASASTPVAQAGNRIQINELDPCKLVTRENVEAALGQPVDVPIVAQDATVTSCTYIAVPGEKFVTVAIYKDENARNYLLNEIAQLQNGCQLSLGTASDASTPFPPEVEALRTSSMEELFVKDLTLQDGCGFGAYSHLTDLGENAYTGFAFIQGAVIGVATDDAFVTFLVADTGSTRAAALDIARKIVSTSISK